MSSGKNYVYSSSGTGDKQPGRRVEFTVPATSGLVSTSGQGWYDTNYNSRNTVGKNTENLFLVRSSEKTLGDSRYQPLNNRQETDNLVKSFVTTNMMMSSNVSEPMRITSTKPSNNFGPMSSQMIPGVKTTETVSMNNYVDELGKRNQMLQLKCDDLRKENEKLAKDSRTLLIVQSRLEEKTSENEEQTRRINSMNAMVDDLKSEMVGKQNKINALTEQINQIFQKMPGKIYLDQSNRILTSDEYKLQQELQNIQSKYLSAQSEIDKLYTQNYEYKKLLGEEYNEEDEDVTKLRYHNSLQSSNNQIQILNRRMQMMFKENDMLRTELNFLRATDILGDGQIQRKVTRALVEPDTGDPPTQGGQPNAFADSQKVQS